MTTIDTPISSFPAGASDELAPARTRRPGLLRSMSWSFIGNVFDVSCTWLFMTILVKLGTSEMVGQYGLAMAYLGPIFAFTNMQMRALQATDARQQTTFGTYLVMRLITLTVAFAALGVVITAAQASSTIILLSLLLFFRQAMLAIEDIFSGMLQQHEWIDRMAQVQMASSGVLIGAFTIGLVTTDSLKFGITLSAAAILVTLFAVHLPMTRRLARATPLRRGLHIHWDRRELTALLANLLPLGIISFMISLQSSVPRFFLDHRTNTSEVGVFVALTTLLVAGYALMSSVSEAIVPRLARMRADQDRAGFIALLVRVEIAAFVILIAGLSATWVLGPTVIRIIFSAEYARYTNAQLWIAAAVGLGLMGRFLGNAITIARQLKIQILTNMLSLSSMVGFCMVLIPRFGLTGAVAAVTCTTAMQVLLNLAVFMRFLRSWKPDSSEHHRDARTARSQEDSTACVD